MFVFTSHLTVPEAGRPALERHCRERSRLVDAFPRSLYLQFLRPQTGHATHTFLTAWESRQAFSDDTRRDERRVSHSREPVEIMARTACVTRHSGCRGTIASHGNG